MKRILAACLFLAACATSTDIGTESTPAFSANAFKAHVQFLASDLLEGREAGTAGYDIAAEYVATQFELMGLVPGGADGSWFQPVPLRASWRNTDQISLTLIRSGESTELVFQHDFLLRSSPIDEVNEFEGEAVFVGFGIDAPNRGHNDYEGLDVRDKIVVSISGFPKGWPSEEGAYYSSGANKAKTAQKYGAKAGITVYTDLLEMRAPWVRMTQNPNRMSLSWIDKNGVPHTSAPSIRIGGILSPDASGLLFDGAPRSYETIRQEANEGAPSGFALPVRLSLKAGNRYEDKVSANVVGMVRGTDPVLRNEYVVITGHLDHLGIGTPVDGDAIYNGALDNAAGIAAMLEAARALQSDPPRRSVIFLAVTAEEKGLLGADYYARNPTVPIESIVANVNLDMPVLTYDFTNVIGFGATHSSLEQSMRTALAKMGLGLAPDPFPQQAIFVRSDHYRFVQQGVPAIMLATGTDSVDGKGKGLEQLNAFLRTHYHQPSDELNRDIDFAAGAKFAEVNYYILKAIADATERPTWNEGDFFGDLFSSPSP